MPDLLLGPELFRLAVPGQAAGAGSKTAMPVRRKDGSLVFDGKRLILNYVHDSDLTEPWMEKVEAMAGSKHGGSAPIDGALWLNVTFYEVRPSTHFMTDGRRLHPEAPAWPAVTSTHDVDKLRRAISDSLTNAKVLHDDKRVIGGSAWKLYADQPPRRACAVISLGRMLHQTVEEAEIPSPPPPGQEVLT